MCVVLTKPSLPLADRCENASISTGTGSVPLPLTSKSARLLQLDGVRGLAVLMVLIYHYVVGPSARSPLYLLRFISRLGIEGWTGVDLFFVLSGFLIGGILIDTKQQIGYVRTFYTRRVFRILPVYILLCGSFFLWRWLSRGAHETIFATPWYAYVTFTQNLWFANHGFDPWMAHTWSLAVEEQFYLALPFIVWALPSTALWKIAGGIALASLLFRSLMYLRFYPWWITAAHTLSFCRADALMLGVLGATLLRNPRWCAELKRHRRALSRVAAALGLPLLVVTAKGWGGETVPTQTLGFTLIAVSYLVLVLSVVLNDGWLKRVFCMRWLVGMGTISYGLYIIHPPILILVYSYFGYEQPRLDRAFDVLPMLLAVALSVGVSLLSWKYFESKLVRFGHGFRFEQRESPVAT